MSGDDKDFLDSLRARAAGWLNEEPEATDAIPHDVFDEMTLAEVREGAGDFDRQVVEYRKDYDYVEALFADLFYLLHKGDPQIRERADMAPTHVPNREIIEAFSKLQEVKDLRDFTRGDPFGTAMGILSLDTEIHEALERMRAAQELAQKLAQLREQLLELAQEAAEAGEAGDEAGLVEAVAAGMEVEEEAAALASQLGEEAEDAAAAAAQAARPGLQQAVEEAEGLESTAAMFGTEPGELRTMDVAARKALVKQLRGSRMAAFTQLFGAMRNLSLAERRRRVDHVPAEIAGLQTSDDLARLAPAEYLNLASPELENDFWMRFANHQLSTWRTRGTERQGKGPIILVCDESSSMDQADVGGYTREAWSKAFVLAVASIAAREDRGVHYIGFASKGQVWEKELTRTQRSGGHTGRGKKPSGLGAAYEVCEHFFGGGTRYEEPLQQALALALTRQEADGLDRPDIVFITDDDYTTIAPKFMRQWEAAKEKLSLTCYGVHIGPGPRSSGALDQVCDVVAQLRDLASGQSLAADIFRAL